MTPANARGDAGSMLIETMVALGLLFIVMAGLLAMDSVAAGVTENQGHLASRTTEYAQDKMEQLLALAYGDATSDTTVFPAATSGGTGLAVGGSATTSAPAAGYVDYLDQNGKLLVAAVGAAPAGWYYERVWQIAGPSTNLKQITISVIVKQSFGGAELPQTTMTALKSFPF